MVAMQSAQKSNHLGSGCIVRYIDESHFIAINNIKISLVIDKVETVDWTHSFYYYCR